MDKKGVAIGVTTIVIIVIALLVLVVVIAAFAGQFGGFGRAVRDCGSKGGTCREFCEPEETQYFGVGMCKDAGVGIDRCCISITGAENKLAKDRTCSRDSECISNKCTKRKCE